MTANVSAATIAAASTTGFRTGCLPPEPPCTTGGTSRVTARAASSVRGTSAHQSARHPSDHGQQTSEKRSDQIRHSRARAPGPQGTAAPFGRRAADRSRERRRADEARAGSLENARGDDYAELGASAPAAAAAPRRPSPASATRRGANAVDECAARKEQQRVGAEVRAQNQRARRAADAEATHDRRQGDGDERAIELQERDGRGARGQAAPTPTAAAARARRDSAVARLLATAGTGFRSIRFADAGFTRARQRIDGLRSASLRPGLMATGCSSSSSPGGSPVNSQARRSRALETVGRRAATRSARTVCVRRSGTLMPSPLTRRQRPARCQKRASADGYRPAAGGQSPCSRWSAQPGWRLGLDQRRGRPDPGSRRRLPPEVRRRGRAPAGNFACEPPPMRVVVPV